MYILYCKNKKWGTEREEVTQDFEQDLIIYLS